MTDRRTPPSDRSREESFRLLAKHYMNALEKIVIEDDLEACHALASTTLSTNPSPSDHAEPIAWLRHGEKVPIQGCPFGAMWISDKDDPRSFPVYAAQPLPPSQLQMSTAPVGYATKNELTKLRLGASCIDLFGEVVPVGFEMVPLYAHPPAEDKQCCGKPVHVGSPEAYTVECCEKFVSPPPVGEKQGWEAEEKLTVEEAWTILCETPDITSPEEYPDHALITMEQLGSFMARATLPKWLPAEDAPRGTRALIRHRSGLIDVVYKTNNGEPFLETWRYAGTARGGEQAPWPETYMPLSALSATATEGSANAD